MSRCFVMQPFDNGPFDARFEDTIAPSIEEAGLEPYRVDRDPRVTIPIQDIEAGIRDATVCLADISLDNPNVWFELGFAIAAQKEVVMICSDDRSSKFPFDVQHRSIIKYKTGSVRDFSQLRTKITERLKAILEKESVLSQVTDLSKLRKIEGLDQAEVVVLAAICENIDSPEDHASTWQLERDMENSGFTGVATKISLKSLSKMGLVTFANCYDGRNEYIGYTLTDSGWDWVLANKNQFSLKKEAKRDASRRTNKYDLDDDIPF